MKKLQLYQMENVEGGKKGCGLAILGLATSIAGGLISVATLNPFGIGISIAGIYGSGPGMLLACELV